MFYCALNGWLEPEIAVLTRNFTAIQAKAKDLCDNKYTNEKFGKDRMTLFGGVLRALTTVAAHADARVVKDIGSAMLHPKEWKNISKTIDNEFANGKIFDERSAGIAAAWNCALGDLACDMTYCNYAYCKLPGGRVGWLEQCEGWDAVRGMPASYPK